MEIHKQIELEKINHGIVHTQSITKSESEPERSDAAYLFVSSLTDLQQN